MDTTDSLNMACFLQVCSHEAHPLHVYGVINLLIIVIITILGTLYVLLIEIKQIHIHVYTQAQSVLSLFSI